MSALRGLRSYAQSLQLSKWLLRGSGKEVRRGEVAEEAGSSTRLLVGCQSFHRLTPTSGIGRHEQVADGLHSVQETITALMCQTKGRREKIGVGQAGLGWRALRSSGSQGPGNPKP